MRGHTCDDVAWQRKRAAGCQHRFEAGAFLRRGAFAVRGGCRSFASSFCEASHAQINNAVKVMLLAGSVVLAVLGGFQSQFRYCLMV